MYMREMESVRKIAVSKAYQQFNGLNGIDEEWFAAVFAKIYI